MRYITRAPLIARLRSNSLTTIFIPPGELLDAVSDPESPILLRIKWRGQDLRADRPEVDRTAERTESVTA
jgi:hypothetical protein